MVEASRLLVAQDLRDFTARQQWSLVKAFYEEPSIHFECWVHRARGRLELGLHFETRDARRNALLMDYVAGDMPFFKSVLGESLEAEPWEKGWTRIYRTRALGPLVAEFQTIVAQEFASLIDMLEPARREALEACASTAP
jgi:hypothetical protein